MNPARSLIQSDLAARHRLACDDITIRQDHKLLTLQMVEARDNQHCFTDVATLHVRFESRAIYSIINLATIRVRSKA